MRLEHLLSGDGRLSLSFEREIIREVRKDRRDVVSQDKTNRKKKMPGQAVKGRKNTLTLRKSHYTVQT